MRNASREDCVCEASSETPWIWRYPCEHKDWKRRDVAETFASSKDRSEKQILSAPLWETSRKGRFAFKVGQWSSKENIRMLDTENLKIQMFLLVSLICFAVGLRREITRNKNKDLENNKNTEFLIHGSFRDEKNGGGGCPPNKSKT
ncbi:hypothetical protein PMV_161 [Port-miou virus]|uniref:Uncharacterized protein n=1 Tax=Port-miou virus TaxID=1733873 RepID=A0A0N9PVI1_9VIRU|nr:hypothetical protein PMV_161 [Port-miou virus]